MPLHPSASRSLTFSIRQLPPYILLMSGLLSAHPSWNRPPKNSASFAHDSAMMIKTPRRNSPPHDRQLAGAHPSLLLAAPALAALLLPCRRRHLRLRPLR